jgi:hypothetical protein
MPIKMAVCKEVRVHVLKTSTISKKISLFNTKIVATVGREHTLLSKHLLLRKVPQSVKTCRYSDDIYEWINCDYLSWNLTL